MISQRIVDEGDQVVAAHERGRLVQGRAGPAPTIVVVVRVRRRRAGRAPPGPCRRPAAPPTSSAAAARVSSVDPLQVRLGARRSTSAGGQLGVQRVPELAPPTAAGPGAGRGPASAAPAVRAASRRSSSSAAAAAAATGSTSTSAQPGRLRRAAPAARRGPARRCRGTGRRGLQVHPRQSAAWRGRWRARRAPPTAARRATRSRSPAGANGRAISACSRPPGLCTNGFHSCSRTSVELEQRPLHRGQQQLVVDLLRRVELVGVHPGSAPEASRSMATSRGDAVGGQVAAAGRRSGGRRRGGQARVGLSSSSTMRSASGTKSCGMPRTYTSRYPGRGLTEVASVRTARASSWGCVGRVPEHEPGGRPLRTPRRQRHGPSPRRRPARQHPVVDAGRGSPAAARPRGAAPRRSPRCGPGAGAGAGRHDRVAALPVQAPRRRRCRS